MCVCVYKSVFVKIKHLLTRGVGRMRIWSELKSNDNLVRTKSFVLRLQVQILC